MSYKVGITSAIEELKERNGSSIVAIKKIMQSKLDKDKKWQNATFLTALKSAVKTGDFVQVKKSYKLSPEFKKKRVDAAKPKKVAKKTTAVTKKATASKKKVAPKKSAPKKKSVSKTVNKKKDIKKSAPKKKASAAKKTKVTTKK